jgi:hypothetical protein
VDVAIGKVLSLASIENFRVGVEAVGCVVLNKDDEVDNDAPLVVADEKTVLADDVEEVSDVERRSFVEELVLQKVMNLRTFLI